MPNYGMHRGRVVDATELSSNGRVRVQVPSLGLSSSAAPVAYTSSCAWGIQVGAVVLVAFEGGDISRPVVVGQIDG
jgi:uncharacterized protein involved in type VI secretion and phage assembly